MLGLVHNIGDDLVGITSITSPDARDSGVMGSEGELNPVRDG